MIGNHPDRKSGKTDGDTRTLMERVIEDIRNVVGEGVLYVGFSGGEDSSLVAILAKEALGRDRVVLVTIDWGIFTYNRSREIVKRFSREHDLKHIFVDGSRRQKEVWKFGPSCNACTKRVKIPLLKRVAGEELIATGANSYDTWGKTGIKVKDGVYAPLYNLKKEQIRSILDFIGVKVEKIGESIEREGCKLKNLLKMLINEEFHGEAVSVSNEVLLDILERWNFKAEKASVKIIGPLSKNIAVIVVKPTPPDDLIRKITERISEIETVDDVIFVRENAVVHVVASPPIYKNPSARKNIENVIGIPGKYIWHESKNNRLRTFQVVEVEI